MSGDTHATSDTHGTHDGGGASHGTRRGYLVGFGLSVLLTAVPFAVVMAGGVSATVAAGVCMAFALVQIVVHMVFFLHMNSRSEGGWTLMALIFTVIIVAIALTGSLWVMYHMNANMMPGMDQMVGGHMSGGM